MIMRLNNDNRITIPHKIRKALELEHGQEFEIEITEDKKNILIRPIESLRVCPKCFNIMKGNRCVECDKEKKEQESKTKSK